MSEHDSKCIKISIMLARYIKIINMKKVNLLYSICTGRTIHQVQMKGIIFAPIHVMEEAMLPVIIK